MWTLTQITYTKFDVLLFVKLISVHESNNIHLSEAVLYYIRSSSTLNVGNLLKLYKEWLNITGHLKIFWISVATSYCRKKFFCFLINFLYFYLVKKNLWKSQNRFSNVPQVLTHCGVETCNKHYIKKWSTFDAIFAYGYRPKAMQKFCRLSST